MASWISWSYDNLKDAELHLEQTMASEVGNTCNDPCDGYHCTLFKAHVGRHECWSGHKFLTWWPNLKEGRTH